MPATPDTGIRGGHIIPAEGRFDAALAITAGRSSAIGQGLPSAAVVIDASGLWVLPGGIDPHCHIEQMSGMGLMNADTWETATRSAAIGGTTSVIAFAAQAKGQGLKDAVSDYQVRASRGAHIDYAFHLMLTDPSVEAFDDELTDLINAGHRSLKVFTTYLVKLPDVEILRIMTRARAAGALLCVHAENDGMIAWAKSALLSQGRTRPDHHAVSHPRLAEVEAIERLCHFAAYTGCATMIFHVSTSEGAAVIRRAQGRGAPVLAETCPHYLLMTADTLEKPGTEGAKWMCSPPQRQSADQEALWVALQRGDLCLVSSDHAPYRYDETGKLSQGPNPSFDKIANGLPGLETRLPLVFDAMIHGGRGSPEDFVRLTSTAPAQAYGLHRKGRIAPGCDADLTIWDPSQRHTYGENDLQDGVGYNPWVGREIKGRPVRTLLRGRTVARDGQLAVVPGTGSWIERPDAPRATAPHPEALATGAIQ